MDTAAQAEELLRPDVIYGILVLVGGIASIFYVSKNWKTWLTLRRPLGAWRLSWLDFSLFAWGIVCIVIFSAPIGQALMGYFPGGDKPVEDNLGLFVVCSGTVMQGGFILLFCALVNLKRAVCEGAISPRSLTLPKQVGYSFVLLLASFPLINIATLAWTFLLEILTELGLPVTPQSQEVVLVFLENRDNPYLFFGMMFVAVVLAPIGEELIFRGGIFRFLLSKMEVWPAALISSMLFGVLHLNLYGIVPLSLLGLAMCYGYYLTGNIRVPIIMHMIFNANTILIVWFFPDYTAL